MNAFFWILFEMDPFHFARALNFLDLKCIAIF